MEAHQKAWEILEGVQWRQKMYYDLGKRTTIYEDGDVVLKKNNTGVLGYSKKFNQVWKGIFELEDFIMISRQKHYIKYLQARNKT